MNKEKILEDLLNKLDDNIAIPDTYEKKVSLWEDYVIQNDRYDLSDDVLLLEDKYLRLDLLNRPLTDAEGLDTINVSNDSKNKYAEKLALWTGDITVLYVDGIVCPTTKSILGTFDIDSRSLDKYVHIRSGMRLRIKCNLIMAGKELDKTEAIVTRSFNLPADCIIHSVIEDIKNEKDLKQAYENILECAKNNLIKTLAIPLLGKDLDIMDSVDEFKLATNCVLDYLVKFDKFFTKIIFVLDPIDYDNVQEIVNSI